jgi:hypothetical protein
MKLDRRMCVCALLAACSQDPIATSANAVTAREPFAQRAPDELALDVSVDGDILAGTLTPPPPQSDADRLLSVRWLSRDGAPRPWRFAREDVLEARFVAHSSAVLVLTREHKLVRLDRPESEGVELDRDVLGPLSLDRAGRTVAYVRGEMPDYQVIRTEIFAGAPRPLAPELVPAWCPTIVDDEVIVVASPEGTPALYRLREGRAPERWTLAPETPLPTGPSAVVVRDRTLVYESDGAVHSLSLDGARGPSLSGASLPMLSSDGASVLVHETDTLRVRAFSLSPARVEASR